MRVDKWVAEHNDGISRSYVAKLIDEGRVRVNGNVVKSSFKVGDDDEIEIDFPEPEELEVTAENIPLDIVYEDSDVIVVNKPKGMVVHPAPGHYSGTLVNALMYHCGDSLSGINGVLRPGIVHRIDKDTTGLIVACKNDKAHESLSEQFEKHSQVRKYRAIVHGVIKEDEGTIKASIARHPTDRKKMTIDNFKGREAITHFKVLERFKEFTYIECELETGRTHQIRVHLKSINHPVLGDEVYGPSKCPLKNLQGQCLHAYLLGFIHPSTGEYIELRSNPVVPEYFTEILRKLPR